MKKLFLMLMLLAGINMFAQAQTKVHKTPQQKAQHYTNVLQKKLALTADQSVKVKTILLKRATQMDSLKTNKATADHKLNRLARRKIMLGADDEVKAILNAGQQKTYADLKASMREKNKAKRAAKAPVAG